MIVLVLSCSISYCQNDTILLTGEVSGLKQDSVLVPISAIKTANSKMLELKYANAKIEQYDNLLYIDSLIINGLNEDISNLDNYYNNEIDCITKQRNRAIIYSGTVTGILLVILSTLIF